MMLFSNTVKPELRGHPWEWLTHRLIQVQGFANLRVSRGNEDGERAKYLSQHKLTSNCFQLSFVKRKEVNSDLPSLTTLSRVSRFQDQFHSLTSQQLISYAFLKSQTPQNFGAVGFVSKLDINRQPAQHKENGNRM